MAGRLPRFGSYVVQRGDSLWKISVKAYGSGIFWKDISRANHLPRPEFILVGLKLRIPIAEVSESKTAYNPVLDAHPSPVPHVLTTPAHTLTATTEHRLDEKTKSGPFRLPSPVLFPEFKYSLDGMKMEAPGNPKIEAKFTGELTMHLEGTINAGVTLTQKGAEAEYKPTVDTAFQEMFTKCTPKIEDGKLTMELGIGGGAKINGQLLYTTETTILLPVPPDLYRFKWTMHPRDVKGTYKGVEFTGTLGYEVEVSGHDNKRKPNEIGVTVVRWVIIAGVAYVVASAVIVVADAVKDFFTAGVGAVETPLSWAAAAALFAEGMTMIRGVPAAP